MKEIKLFIDTGSLDQVQANMNACIADMRKFQTEHIELENQLKLFFDLLYTKISTDIRSVVREETKRCFQTEFEKIVFRKE